MAISVAPAPRGESISDRPPRARSLPSKLTTALLVVSVLLAALVGAGAVAGYRGEVILTGSMRPAIDPGDLVVVRAVSVRDVRPGDIISFRAQAGFMITHRVAAVSTRRNGGIAVTTKGDANTAAEHWTTTPDARVGRVVATLPTIGKVTHWTGSPIGRLVVLGFIGSLLAGLALRRIWSR